MHRQITHTTIAELVTALSRYPLHTPVGVAVVEVEGVAASVAPFDIEAIDCSLAAGGQAEVVWLVARDAEGTSAPLGITMTCASCGAARYVQDGDEIPACCLP